MTWLMWHENKLCVMFSASFSDYPGLHPSSKITKRLTGNLLLKDVGLFLWQSAYGPCIHSGIGIARVPYP